MTKNELYDALKADGAKMNKGVRFYNVEELRKMYVDRFGVNPDEPEEVPNSHLLSDGDEIQSAPVPADEKIRTLKFAESGWCNELGRSYFCGLYRPKTLAEYRALKKYAAEVLG